VFLLTLASSVEKENLGFAGVLQGVFPTCSSHSIHSREGFELSSGPATPNGKISPISPGKYLLNSPSSCSFASLSRVTFLILALLSAVSLHERFAIRSTQSKRLDGDGLSVVSFCVAFGGDPEVGGGSLLPAFGSAVDERPVDVRSSAWWRMV